MTYNTLEGVNECNNNSTSISTDELRGRLISTMELDSNMQKYVGNKMKFKISGVQIEYIEVNKGELNNSDTLSFSATLTLSIPMQLGNDNLGNITKPLKVKATYIPLF